MDPERRDSRTPSNLRLRESWAGALAGPGGALVESGSGFGYWEAYSSAGGPAPYADLEFFLRVGR